MGERVVLTRILRVLASCDPERRILSAHWDSDLLIVQSGAFRTLIVSKERVAEAIGSAAKGTLPASAWKFELDLSGAFLYWKRFDSHMGWEQLEQAVNPAKRLRAQQTSRSFNLQYGRAICGIRKERGVHQNQIPGLTERQVRRIEHGEVRATLAALQKLASAHGMSVNRYMEAIAEKLPDSLR